MSESSKKTDKSSEWRKAEEIIKRRGQVDPREIPLLDRLAVIQEIDERISHLRKRASLILVIIGMTLLAAATIVVLAGRLTRFDSDPTSGVDRAKNEIAEVTRNFNKLKKYQFLLQDRDDLSKRTDLSDMDKQKRIADNTRELEKQADPASPPDLVSATSMVRNQQAQLNNLDDLLNELYRKELTANPGYGDLNFIVATAITRVGVVLIIVFLVQILLGLYRYNTRLVAYYSSRRDLLTLWADHHKELELLVNVFTVPIDFDKEPKHPLDDLFKAIKAVGEKFAAPKGPSPLPGPSK